MIIVVNDFIYGRYSNKIEKKKLQNFEQAYFMYKFRAIMVFTKKKKEVTMFMYMCIVYIAPYIYFEILSAYLDLNQNKIKKKNFLYTLNYIECVILLMPEAVSIID